MTIDSELWFPIRDLRPLALHSTTVATHPHHTGGPALRLSSQGPLVFLTATGNPDLLLDPRDPHSVQRAYADGRAQPHPGQTTVTAPVRSHGSLALTGPDTLATTLLRAHGSRRWLVITPTASLPWRVAARPGPPPRTGWIEGELCVLGLGGYQGQYAERHTWRGWCCARFPATTAAAIAANVNALPRGALRRGLTRLRLTNQPTDRDGTLDPDGVLTVGPDPDGCYRIGTGRWQWVTLNDLEPEDHTLEPFEGPIPDGVDPASMPAIGQLAYHGDDLMWLTGGIMYGRDYSGHHIWPGDTPIALSRHHHVHPTIRVAEYLLRSATADAAATGRHHHRRPRQPDRAGIPPSANTPASAPARTPTRIRP